MSKKVLLMMLKILSKILKIKRIKRIKRNKNNQTNQRPHLSSFRRIMIVVEAMVQTLHILVMNTKLI